MSYILSWRRPKPRLLKDFEGRYYNKNPKLNWTQYIPIPTGPIKYLEIGVYNQKRKQL